MTLGHFLLASRRPVYFSYFIYHRPMPHEDLEWKIYLIRNAVNGKGYVGITHVWPIDIRLHQHFAYSEELPAKAYMSNGRLRPLYAAMRKYGVDKFSIEVLGITMGQEGVYEAMELEKNYIKDYETYGSGPMHKRNGYNVTEGGEWPFDD